MPQTRHLTLGRAVGLPHPRFLAIPNLALRRCELHRVGMGREKHGRVICVINVPPLPHGKLDRDALNPLRRSGQNLVLDLIQPIALAVARLSRAVGVEFTNGKRPAVRLRRA